MKRKIRNTRVVQRAVTCDGSPCTVGADAWYIEGIWGFGCGGTLQIRVRVINLYINATLHLYLTPSFFISMFSFDKKGLNLCLSIYTVFIK